MFTCVGFLFLELVLYLRKVIITLKGVRDKVRKGRGYPLIIKCKKIRKVSEFEVHLF